MEKIAPPQRYDLKAFHANFQPEVETGKEVFTARNLQIGYDFKYKLLKNTPWLSNLTLSLVGQNLFTISKANDYYIDPEQNDTNNFGYPITKTYSLVLNIGF